MMKKKPVRFFLLLFGIPALTVTAFLVYRFSWSWLAAWLLAVNLAALFMWGWDKFQARRKGWRVPEMALHFMAIVGATPAAFVGMQLFRHKTMKMHFTILYTVVFLLQCAAAYVLTDDTPTP